jgi:hypothetical protein
MAGAALNFKGSGAIIRTATPRSSPGPDRLCDAVATRRKYLQDQEFLQLFTMQHLLESDPAVC